MIRRDAIFPRLVCGVARLCSLKTRRRLEPHAMKFILLPFLALLVCPSVAQKHGQPAEEDAHAIALPSDGNGAFTQSFFVCGSKVRGMDGRYVRQHENVVQSDPETPVFRREDQSDDDIDVLRDFRLFRHGGFWMFADAAPWPPTTLFRCDPTNSKIEGVDALAACGFSLPEPPNEGYSPVDSGHAVDHIQLRSSSCNDSNKATINSRISLHGVKTEL